MTKHILKFQFANEQEKEFQIDADKRRPGAILVEGLLFVQSFYEENIYIQEEDFMNLDLQ